MEKCEEYSYIDNIRLYLLNRISCGDKRSKDDIIDECIRLQEESEDKDGMEV